MCIQWTRVLFPDVITWQSNPPISQVNIPCNEFTSAWLMCTCTTHTIKVLLCTHYFVFKFQTIFSLTYIYNDENIPIHLRRYIQLSLIHQTVYHVYSLFLTLQHDIAYFQSRSVYIYIFSIIHKLNIIWV